MQIQRVAHVFPSQSWGGAEIYSIELATRQRQAGLSVLIWGTAGSRLVKEAEKRGLKVLTEPLSMRTDFVSLPRLMRVLKREKISHLHLHWSGGVWAFFGAARFAKVRVIYHNHMWIKHYKYDPFHWLAYKFVDRMIVAGDRARSSAQKYISINKEKIRVVPYGIDLDRPRKLRTKRSDWKIPEDAFVLGCFARIDFQKGQKEFLEALRALDLTSKVHVFLVGDPTANEKASMKYSQELDEIISNHPLRERIQRLPSRSDYLELLRHCDVLVAPSYHESYSLMILDAFMLGVPVISTDSGGTPDLVADKVRGWLVPPQSTAELQSLLSTIERNKNVKGMGLKAKEYVFSKHSFDHVLSQMMKVYQD